MTRSIQWIFLLFLLGWTISVHAQALPDLQPGDRVMVLQNRIDVHTSANQDSPVATDILRGLVSQVIAVQSDWVYLSDNAYGWIPLTVDGQPTVTLFTPELLDKQIEDATAQIEVNTYDLEANLTRGAAYLSQKKYDLAGEDFIHAIESQIDDIRVFEYQGLGYLAMGDFSNAAYNFQQVIDGGHETAGNYNRIGVCNFNQEFPYQAIESYHQAIALTPDWGLPYSNLGNALRQTNQIADAFAVYQQAINNDPYLLPAYINRGLLYEQIGSYDDALDDYNQAIQIAPFYSPVYVKRGYFYSERRGDFNAALDDFNHAIALDPRNDDAYSARAYFYNVHQGQRDLAIQDYKQALTLNPANAYAYLNLGGIYGYLGHYRDALNTYTEGLESPYADFTLTVRTYMLRSQMYAALGDYDNALADLDRFQQINGRLDYFAATGYLVEGYIRLYQGDYDAALTAYGFAFGIQPQFSKDYYVVGEFMRPATSPEPAIADLQQQMTDHPDEADYPIQLANLYMQFGRWPEAMEAYRQALELSPNPDLENFVTLFKQLLVP